MISLFRRYFILCCVALVACAPLGSSTSGALNLAPPGQLGQSVQVTQQVDIHWQGKTHQLLVVWSQQNDVFLVLGLSAAGQVLFRADFDGDRYQQHTSVAELEQMDLKQLLRHIQIAYWPVASINELLLGSGAVLELAPEQRNIRSAGKLVAQYTFADQQPFSSLDIQAATQPRLSVTTLKVETLNSVKAGTIP